MKMMCRKCVFLLSSLYFCWKIYLSNKCAIVEETWRR
nr:MAG TPA: hypothetical protein [Caudoviricetes sp.]